MPKTPINYANTIMYKLVCNDLEVKECYVGHTTNFIKRRQSHKDNCYNEKNEKYNLKEYIFMRENGGWTNWTMLKLEDYPCKDVNEARKRERELYEELNARLNSVCPYRTQEERDNPHSTYKEKKRLYNEANKEHFAKLNAEYNRTHKEQHNKAVAKYKEANKEQIKQKKREYFHRTKQRVCCELCGLEMLNTSLNLHTIRKH